MVRNWTGVAADLLKADTRITALTDPVAVTIGDLPGYRYRYTYRAADKTEGAHVHYFLFREGRLIQLVFQVTPAARLDALERTFDEIAGSFKVQPPQ